MRTNNFQRLMDDEMKGAPPLPPQIKNNVQGNMGFFQFLGKTVELYLPRALDVVLASLGGAAAADPPSKKPAPGKDAAAK
ncbi:MAG: hypothetical protein IPH04_00385 [Saprospirales bacterium]|nr:hypothetical protein [Saprospirales bacterium]MBK6901294.1 hypothetical protein [Saprospirales bacterium]MBK7335959.1 hypothetical protein [Saprospirales bacterium]